MAGNSGQRDRLDPAGRPVGRGFSPARALEAVGDRWSLLVIRAAMFREMSGFSDFEQSLGVPGDILAARLDELVGAGLMELRTRSTGADRYQYVLTENGRNLEPVIVALVTWSDGWITAADTPATIERDAEIAAAIRVATSPRGAPVTQIEISVLGAFALRVAGKTIGPLPTGSQRLLAFLALHDRTVARVAVAGSMWPEVSDERAGISLRSALSRLDIATRDTILSASAGLSLVETVAVDLRNAQALAQRLLQPDANPDDADLGQAAVATLSSELLPDWYDDWVVAVAEDWRQLRMTALEAQSSWLVARNRLSDAVGAARAAIKVEPLRESAHAALIKVHLAEGNQSEALRAFDRYRTLLNKVLGIQPTTLLSDLVADIQNTSGPLADTVSLSRNL